MVTDTNKDLGGDGTGLGTAGLVVIVLVALAVLGLLLSFVFRRYRMATIHVRESNKSSDGNLPEADGSTSLAVPSHTQTFESDPDEKTEDLPQVQAVDSGHLA